MHSFQPSRGRILFEVACAVVIGASCGGAWLQTGASALLAAASVTTLYGLVRFFDLFRREPSLAAEPQRIDFASDGQAVLSTVESVAAPEPAVEEVADILALDPRLADFGEPKIVAIEPVAAEVDEVAPAKAPRKGSRRTAGSQKKAKASAPEPVVEVAEPAAADDVPHTHVAPLFEPDPYFRMQRQGFGRRGRI